MGLAVGIVVVLGMYAAFVAGGLWVRRWALRRGLPRPVALAVMFFAQAFLVACIALTREQLHVRGLAGPPEEGADVRLIPPPDPIPEPSPPTVKDRWFGPWLIRREVTEWGVPELQGGMRVSKYQTPPWVLTAQVFVPASLAWLVSIAVLAVHRRRRRRAATPPQSA